MVSFKYEIRDKLRRPWYDIHLTVAQRIQADYDITTSSVSSIISSTHSSTVSRSSSDLATGAADSPAFFLSASNSFVLLARHAFHSSMSRRRCAISSAETLLSSAASSSSNRLLYSRRFFRIFFCSSLGSRVWGRGRHKNCLNLSSWLRDRSCPLKSQMVYPDSGCGKSQRRSLKGRLELTEFRKALASDVRYRPEGSQAISLIP